MAPSPLRSKSLYHARSNSLPSSSQSSIAKFEDHLRRLRESEASPLSLPLLSSRVIGFQVLYDNVDDLISLPHIRQIISRECQDKCLDEILDGYIGVLDACSIAKDVFLSVRQDIQELLSALRRRDLDKIYLYLTSRRKTKSMIQKSVKDLKRGNKLNEEETMALVYMLKEAECVTLAMLESVLSSAMGAKAQPKQSGWSLVSKLMGTTKVSSQGKEMRVNEFEKVDTALSSLVHLKSSKENDTHIGEIICQLKIMESSIQELEEGLECLFRRLIKSRAFLLNILNH